MKVLTYNGIQFPIRSAKHKQTEAKSSAEVTKDRWRYWLKKISQNFWRILGLQLRKKISYLNLPIPSNQFDKEEQISERFPMKGNLGSWQLSIGTLTEKLRLVVLEEAQFGCRRWSYVQRTFANLRPKSSCWNNQTTEKLSIEQFHQGWN